MLPTYASVLLSAAVALATGCKPAQSDTTAAATPAKAAAPAAATPGAPAGADSLTTLADHGRVRGNEKATLWFVMVSDFQCPFCKRWHDESFAALDRDYVSTGKIRIAYVNLPLNIHQWALPAAEAAMCTAIQGKFWPMHDALFATQEQWAKSTDPTRTFDSLATTSGADLTRWRQCMTEHQTGKLIQADADRVTAAGVRSTPTFFIGDEAIEGAQPYDTFKAAIDRQLAKAGAKSPAPGR